MKLVVLGANGRTGQHVVRNAIDRGETVTAIVRSDAKCPAINHENLRVEIGDPCDPQFLSNAFQDQDAIISTLGGRMPTKNATAIYWKSADAIAEAAGNKGLEKIVATSSALLFPPQRLFDKALIAIVRNIVQSATRMENRLSTAKLTIDVARCGFLTDANDTTYRAEQGILPKNGSTVSRLSLAHFLIDRVHTPSTGFKIYGVSAPVS
ncbi:MAG: NAD(P)-binding oxidoreductase [Pseudoruegeria sp.]